MQQLALAIALLCVVSVRCLVRTGGSAILRRTGSSLKMMPLPSEVLPDAVSSAPSSISSVLVMAEAYLTGYSSLSLYFTLALYLVTLPGLYSLVTRSVKASPTQKIYDIPGPANPTAKATRQTAAEIMAYFKAMNYEVAAAKDTITFRGVMGQSKSQAYFLTFCTFMGLGSIGLVLSILLPDLGSKAYILTLLSPYAGIYYWNNAQRVDEVVIKMETSDDEQVTSVIAQGGKEDLERFSKSLELPERGKIYVRGMFENPDAPESQPVAEVPSSPLPPTEDSDDAAGGGL